MVSGLILPPVMDRQLDPSIRTRLQASRLSLVGGIGDGQINSTDGSSGESPIAAYPRIQLRRAHLHLIVAGRDR